MPRGVEIEYVERFLDSRGEAVIVSQREEVGFIEYVDFATAAVARGSHYHCDYNETLYVISGELTAQLIQIHPGGPAREVVVGPGSLIRIAPLVAHRFVAREPSRAIAFGSGASPLEDRHSVEPERFEQASRSEI